MWPCSIKKTLYYCCIICISYTCITVFGIFLCVLTVSSPYLLMFGDDRIRGIREQVMMQVELVRLNCEEGMLMGIFFMLMFLSLYLNIWCKGSWPTGLNPLFCIYGLVGNLMKFYISHVLGNEALLLNEILNKWCWCIISVLFC